MSSELLTSLLKEVSRSFYLTMRILPSTVRPQISLAYLLARATDTIADTEIIPVGQRLEALEKLRARISGTSDAPLHFGELAQSQCLPAEKILLERCEDSLKLLSRFSSDDQHRIREVLNTITSGQKLDLQRFAAANEQEIVAIQTDSELDDYTYRVAGCVGEFWTRICVAHQFTSSEIAKRKRSELSFEELGVRFGKGLQLVNILRDLPRDLRAGRCYIPEQRLNEAGLTPNNLLSPESEIKFRPVYDQLLGTAGKHLAAGWEYTLQVPRSQVRLRLACAWPILIGAKTIAKLRRDKILDPLHRVKISRAEVRNLILKTVVLYPFSTRWEKQFCNVTRRQECCCVS